MISITWCKCGHIYCSYSPWPGCHGNPLRALQTYIRSEVKSQEVPTWCIQSQSVSSIWKMFSCKLYAFLAIFKEVDEMAFVTVCFFYYIGDYLGINDTWNLAYVIVRALFDSSSYYSHVIYIVKG